MLAKDLVDRIGLLPQRPVPNLAHELRQSGNTTAKSRLLRLSPELEVAFAVTRAVMDEAQE